MATIKYQFSDGHFEKFEVSDKFAANYEKIDKESTRNDWKHDYRNRKLNASFEHLTEQGFDVRDEKTDVEQSFIEQEFLDKLLPLLTEKQRQVFVLFFVKGYTTREIAARLNITHQSVTDQLLGIKKKYLKNFC